MIFGSRIQPVAVVGSLLAKSYEHLNLNLDKSPKHDPNKRSKIESKFSKVRTKSGGALRSKTDVAMRNEALCKVLCHNLCCLIQSVYELGIVATFLGKEQSQYQQLPILEQEEDLAAMAWT